MPDDITYYQQQQMGVRQPWQKKKKKVIQDGNRNPTGIKKNPFDMSKTGGLKGAQNYGYTNYKTGEWVGVDPSAGYGGYRDADLAMGHYGFTKKYNEDPNYRANVLKDRADKGGLMGTLNSLYGPVKSHIEQAVDTARENPDQALLGGMTQAGSMFWNEAAGKDWEPQVTWTGGATDNQISNMEAEGTDTSNFKKTNALADTIALAYAGGYGADQAAAAGWTGGAGGGAGGAGAGGGAGGGMSNANLWNNLLSAGSSLASGYLSKEATEEGIDEIKRQYNLNRQDMKPWMREGRRAVREYSNRLGDDVPAFEFQLEDDPVYQFQLDQAQKATERAMAARGYNNSGNMLLELQRNAIGEAGRYQNEAFNRQLGESQTNYGRDFDRTNQYANLAGLGQSSTNALTSTGTNAANNLANLYLQQGQGYNNAVQGFMQNYMLNNYLNG